MWSKSFGTHITEKPPRGTFFALFFCQALDQMGQKCQYLAKNASFGLNLAVFGPKIYFLVGGSKFLVSSYQWTNETPLLPWERRKVFSGRPFCWCLIQLNEQVNLLQKKDEDHFFLPNLSAWFEDKNRNPYSTGLDSVCGGQSLGNQSTIGEIKKLK